MCKRCENEYKPTKTYNNFGVIDNPVKLCYDCAKKCGFIKSKI